MRAENCLFCAGKGEIPCTEDWHSLAKKTIENRNRIKILAMQPLGICEFAYLDNGI